MSKKPASKGLTLPNIRRYFAPVATAVTVVPLDGTIWLSNTHWMRRVACFAPDVRDAIEHRMSPVELIQGPELAVELDARASAFGKAFPGADYRIIPEASAKQMFRDDGKRTLYVRTRLVVSGSVREHDPSRREYVDIDNGADSVAFLEVKREGSRTVARPHVDADYGTRIAWFSREYVNLLGLDRVWMSGDLTSPGFDAPTLKSATTVLMPQRGQSEMVPVALLKSMVAGEDRKTDCLRIPRAEPAPKAAPSTPEAGPNDAPKVIMSRVPYNGIPGYDFPRV